ncbi:prepilin-type N-terminal cleavage/methylation domain-containing protein [Natronocella acetinitrilica]|uniref:Prepilin-type N-terminal cleavage/methylation domain-containing protein n=1 Tax=Natronocella acetinitrilica TaxID=414046 RepID=A0AAE3G537_9GAMM|nr:prepilin-type N-terminal cleavage/methylation domain-containing protein [Natronocella acetinitrilica]MCP1674563.1 prepilin-type N-terminal cleavage/methylation domain-containing protein [Natronocella acetinitrilica]
MSKRRMHGFTLVELMVALLLATLVVAAAASLFMVVSRADTDQRFLQNRSEAALFIGTFLTERLMPFGAAGEACGAEGLVVSAEGAERLRVDLQYCVPGESAPETRSVSLPTHGASGPIRYHGSEASLAGAGEANDPGSWPVLFDSVDGPELSVLVRSANGGLRERVLAAGHSLNDPAVVALRLRYGVNDRGRLADAGARTLVITQTFPLAPGAIARHADPESED